MEKRLPFLSFSTKPPPGWQLPNSILAAMAQLYRGTFGMTSDDEVLISRPTMRPTALDDPTADPAFVAGMSAAVTLGWKDLDDVGVAVAANRALNLDRQSSVIGWPETLPLWTTFAGRVLARPPPLRDLLSRRGEQARSGARRRVLVRALAIAGAMLVAQSVFVP